MELEVVEAAEVGDLQYLGQRLVDEYADFGDAGRLAGDGRRRRRLNPAAAGGEDEADEIGAGGGRRLSGRQRGYAADFYDDSDPSP